METQRPAHQQARRAAQGLGHGRDDGRPRRRKRSARWPAASPASTGKLDDVERRRIKEPAGGVELTDIVGNLLAAIDPDRIDAKARALDPPVGDDEPAPAAVDQARDLLAAAAAGVFTGELIDLIDSIRRDKEQTIDHDSLDTVLSAEWEGDAQENAQALASFRNVLRRAQTAIEG